MALKGSEKESKGFSKYVGMFLGTPVAVNPSKEELSKLLGQDVTKDLEYTGVDDQTGAKKLTLSFWIKEEKTGTLLNVRFGLQDTVVVAKSGKTQFINDIGTTSYADDQSQLPSWVASREVRKAKKGEELLYKFLRAWLSNLNYEDPNTELVLDWKKLIAGKTSEIRDAISNFSNQSICAMATVRTADDGKEYQGVYSYEFLPAYAMNCFNGTSNKTYKSVDKFIEKVKDAEYGCKDYYELKPLDVYDPSKNVMANNNSPIINKGENKEQPQEQYANASAVDDLPF